MGLKPSIFYIFPGINFYDTEYGQKLMVPEKDPGYDPIQRYPPKEAKDVERSDSVYKKYQKAVQTRQNENIAFTEGMRKLALQKKDRTQRSNKGVRRN